MSHLNMDDVDTDDDPIVLSGNQTKPRVKEPTTTSTSPRKNVKRGPTSAKRKQTSKGNKGEKKQEDEQEDEQEDDQEDDQEQESEEEGASDEPPKDGKDIDDEDNPDEGDQSSDEEIPEENKRLAEIKRLKQLAEKEVVEEILEEGLEVMKKKGQREKINPYRIRYLAYIKAITSKHLDLENGIVAEQPVQFGTMCALYQTSPWFQLSEKDYVSTFCFSLSLSLYGLDWTELD